MPAPAGALTVMLPLYLHFLGFEMSPALAPVALIYMLVIALMVISTVPTFSGKTVGKRVPREYVLPIFVVTVAAFGLLISFPFEILALLSLGYLCAIPIGAAQYRRKLKAEAARPPRPRATTRRRPERSTGWTRKDS